MLTKFLKSGFRRHLKTCLISAFSMVKTPKAEKLDSLTIFFDEYLFWQSYHCHKNFLRSAPPPFENVGNGGNGRNFTMPKSANPPKLASENLNNTPKCRCATTSHRGIYNLITPRGFSAWFL